MNFPKVSEITTTTVMSLPVTAMISEAIDLMYRSGHSHIVITDEHRFFILDIYDILRIEKDKQHSDLRIETLKLDRIPTIRNSANILETLRYLREDHEQIAVLDEDGSLYGIVTQSDILSSIDPDTLMDTYRLSDLLKIKKRNRWISKEMIMQDIIDMMERYDHDAVIVIEEGYPIGIITTKDILRLLKNNADLSLTVETYMTAPVETISQKCTLNEAMRFMQDKHFKQIVTVDGKEKIVGSITQKELISIAYSRWARMVQSYQEELHELNKKLEQKSRKFEKIAATDPLTGLYNRMKFLELFISEYTVMMQRHNTLSLLLMDLDHFKHINDKYGHNTGDIVLKQISNLLLRELRNVDIVCRWGGEEFVILLPAADAEDAHYIAEKVRNAVESFSLEGVPKVTASIGLSQIEEGDELQDVIERADKALYMAKIAGRNCVKSIS